MPQALGSIGTALGGLGSGGGTTPSWMKALLMGMTGAGEVGNIMADKQRSNLLSKENQWANLTPQQLSAKVAAATQPLSAGLTQSVGNTVQAEVGERGLAESPGIFSSVLAQSLAPYYQQNQNTALQEIAQQMGIPVQAGSLLPGGTNLSPLLALLMQSVKKPVPTQTPQPSGGTMASTFPDASSGQIPDWITQGITV